jgi:hypothetical protein
MQRWLIAGSRLLTDIGYMGRPSRALRIFRRTAMNAMNQSSSNQFQLCFRSLFHSGRGFAFPCDPKGQVDLDGMSENARNNYFYARAMVGRELSAPAVETALLH